MPRVVIIALLALLFVSAAAGGEDELYRSIKESAQRGNRAEARDHCAAFLKRFPASHRLGELLAVCGDQEDDRALALDRFRTLVRAYPESPRRSYAQLRLCEIHFLDAAWGELLREAERGTKLWERGTHADEFRFYHALATLQSGRPDTAEEACQRIIDRRHEPAMLSRVLLLMASVQKKNTGLSRAYLRTLRDIILGFPDAPITPTALFLIGEFFDRRGDADRAWSAYGDCISRFPRSPESDAARQAVKALEPRNPHRAPYLPTQEIIDSTDAIDIQPNRPSDDDDRGGYYAVSIGPLKSAARMAEMRRLMSGVGAVRRMKTREGYALLVGNERDADAALALRVRLAEEFGVNGTIVRVSGDGTRTYLYGE